jgi:hypothetical protein
MGRPQRRLRLLQPETHAHLAVHRDRGRQVLVALRAIADAVVERAEAEVAVGHERAHAELGGEGEGLTVVGFGGAGVERITLGGDLAEEVKSPRCLAWPLLPPRQIEGVLGPLKCLIETPGEKVRVTELADTNRIRASTLGDIDGERFFQQGQALCGTSGEGVGKPQSRRRAAKPTADVPGSMKGELSSNNGTARSRSPLLR